MLVLSFLVVACAACVQASVGFAYALLTAPLLQLVSPDLVPGPVLLSSLVLSSLTAWRERSSIDRRGVGFALLGRLPGALLAGLAIGLLPAGTYDVLFGSLVLAATLLSLRRVGLLPSPLALLTAGFASGFMGTLTSVGGPPIALVYQHARGSTLRATLNTYFAIGSLISIGVLGAVERFEVRHALLGCALLPPMALGFYASRFTHGRLEGPRLRPALLAISALGSFAVVVRGLSH
jgi:uncharacterized membrane protein YfcA